MPLAFPQRTENHNREELSVRFFNNLLPENWYSYPPRNDYGVDLIVDIFEGTRATGLELLIQLKSTNNSNESNYETVRMNIATYNLLWSKLQVVMIIKYVIPENEAYWILLKDVPSPNQDNDTFSFYIPKENRLSEIDWDEIKNYIRDVTDRKMAAQRAHLQQRRTITPPNNV